MVISTLAIINIYKINIIFISLVSVKMAILLSSRMLLKVFCSFFTSHSSFFKMTKKTKEKTNFESDVVDKEFIHRASFVFGFLF